MGKGWYNRTVNKNKSDLHKEAKATHCYLDWTRKIATFQSVYCENWIFFYLELEYTSKLQFFMMYTHQSLHKMQVIYTQVSQQACKMTWKEMQCEAVSSSRSVWLPSIKQVNTMKENREASWTAFRRCLESLSGPGSGKKSEADRRLGFILYLFLIAFFNGSHAVLPCFQILRATMFFKDPSKR